MSKLNKEVKQPELEQLMKKLESFKSLKVICTTLGKWKSSRNCPVSKQRRDATYDRMESSVRQKRNDASAGYNTKNICNEAISNHKVCAMNQTSSGIMKTE